MDIDTNNSTVISIDVLTVHTGDTSIDQRLTDLLHNVGQTLKTPTIYSVKWSGNANGRGLFLGNICLGGSPDGHRVQDTTGKTVGYVLWTLNEPPLFGAIFVLDLALAPKT